MLYVSCLLNCDLTHTFAKLLAFQNYQHVAYKWRKFVYIFNADLIFKKTVGKVFKCFSEDQPKCSHGDDTHILKLAFQEFCLLSFVHVFQTTGVVLRSPTQPL